MQEEPVSSVRASPKQQKQNDVTWLQEWAENVQTVNLELQQRKGGNHQEGKMVSLVLTGSRARGTGSTAQALTVPTKPSHFAHGHED